MLNKKPLIPLLCAGFVPRRRHDASALLLSLVAILLVTFAILAFIAQTQNALVVTKFAPTGVEAEALVRASVEATIGDFRKEMLAGAEVDDKRTDFTSLQPLEVRRRWAAVPARAVSSNTPVTGFETLVKQSLRATSFYPGSSPAAAYQSNGPAPATGTQRASAVNSRSSSFNGRTISSARWDQIGLTAAALPDNALPDWIYVTRKGVAEDGSAVTGEKAGDLALGNADYVVGRYAYNIYDAGGLLNINAAGFPSAASGAASEKGGVEWADLTALGLTRAQVDAIVDFRNARTQSGFLDKMRYGAEREGFLKPLALGGASDGFFYSRQDMLQFFLKLFGKKKVAECTSAERGILASFANNTRYLAAPSWVPNPDRKDIHILSPAKGGNNAFGLDDQFNPVVAKLAVLEGKEFTRLRHKDPKNYTGPVEVETVAGEPFLNSRFPVSRLRLLTSTATATTSEDDAIYRYFGLTRVSCGRTLDLRARYFFANSATGGNRGWLGHLRQCGAGAGHGGTPAGRHPLRIAWKKLRAEQQWIGRRECPGPGDVLPGDPNPREPDRPIRRRWLPHAHRIQRSHVLRRRESPVSHPHQGADGALLPDVQPAAPGSTQPFALVFLPEIWNPHDQRRALPSKRPTRFRFVADTHGMAYPFHFKYRIAATGTMSGWEPSINVRFSPETHNMVFGDAVLKASSEPVVLKTADLATSSSPIANITSGLVGLASKEAINVRFEVKDGPINYRYVVGDPGIAFALEYETPSGQWARYFQRDLVSANAPGKTLQTAGRSELTTSYLKQKQPKFIGFDPRSDRFSTYRLQERDDLPASYVDGAPLRPDARSGYGMSAIGETDPNDGDAGSGDQQFQPTDPGWKKGYADPATEPGFVALGTILQNTASSGTRYTDPDGVLRPGDGALASSTGQEGQMFRPGNQSSRPIVLDRPFRSVAEMGYAFRGTPGRSLDFFSADSGDAALLDFFSVEEGPDDGVTSGKVSANTRNPRVLEALLRGALMDEGPDTALSASRARQAAEALVSITASEPLLDRSELATRFLAKLPIENAPERIKKQREVFVRALADSVETRTWNFVIDLIAQTGHIPRGKSALQEFNVESERHVWVHLSMDRMTGRILDLNFEPFYD